ncbi:MAG: hypothetical protein AB7U85_08465 [Alphaproteobacteria bacterium]
MAKENVEQQGDEKQLVIKHVRSNLYREVQPDSFLATQLSDANGYYIKMLVMRNDINVVSETLCGEWNGESMVQFDESVVIEQKPVRIQEVSLRLTPRMAVNLHAALSRELDELPPEIIKQYGIQKEDK